MKQTLSTAYCGAPGKQYWTDGQVNNSLIHNLWYGQLETCLLQDESHITDLISNLIQTELPGYVDITVIPGLSVKIFALNHFTIPYWYIEVIKISPWSGMIPFLAFRTLTLDWSNFIEYYLHLIDVLKPGHELQGQILSSDVSYFLRFMVIPENVQKTEYSNFII